MERHQVLSERAPWPRPGRGAWSPGHRGACVEAAAGPDGHYARVSLRTRRRRKDVSAAQVSLIHGPRWPRGTASPSTWGTAATTSPVGPGPEGSVGPPRPMRANRSRELRSRGRGGLGRAGPWGPAPRPRGGPSEPCSRCRRGATWGGGTAPEKADDTCDRAHRFPTPGLPVLSRAGGAGHFLHCQPVATGSA